MLRSVGALSNTQAARHMWKMETSHSSAPLRSLVPPPFLLAGPGLASNIQRGRCAITELRPNRVPYESLNPLAGVLRIDWPMPAGSCMSLGLRLRRYVSTPFIV